MKIYKYIILLLLLFPSVVFAQHKGESKPVKKEKQVNFAFIPIIMYNNSFGAQFGAMTGAYFDLNKRDTVSPASSVTLFGSVFTNKTYFVGMSNKLYFRQDHWRTMTAIGYGNIIFQTYFEFPEGIPGIPGEGVFVSYKTQMAFIYGEVTGRIGKHLFVGPQLVFSSVHTDFDSQYIPDERLRLFGFGLASNFDLRDNVFNPHKGMNAKFSSFSFLKSLGSSDTYHNINFAYNQYFPLSKQATVMARLYANISFGDTIPFNGKNVVGRDDIRGYTNGKYRANQVFNIQSEYRWNFYKKWGMVAFGGIAIASDNWKGENFSGLLPAIGAGIRYKAIPSRDINIGIDFAVGKGDWGVYFRIGEAFLR